MNNEDRITHLRDVAEATREAAKTAAEHRRAWLRWETAAYGYNYASGVGMSGPPRPTVPKPTDETEDVLLRLAAAIDQKIMEIAEPRVPGMGGTVAIEQVHETPGVGGVVEIPMTTSTNGEDA